VQENLDLATLVRIAEELARKISDGHLTILRFTTHWKCGLGTPLLDAEDGRSEISALPEFATLADALFDLITRASHGSSVIGEVELQPPIGRGSRRQ
jgi:hypothetical protein